MAYSKVVIFIETPPFERIRDDYFDDDQYQLLQAALMSNPGAGDVIPRSRGIRKVRWATDGQGKRGGLRVIYFWKDQRNHIYLLTVYGKSEVTDLTQKEIKVLAAIVQEIKRKN